MVLGIYSNLPWVVPAYYTVATLSGAAILRVEVPPGLLKELTDALQGASWGEFRQLGPCVVAAGVGLRARLDPRGGDPGGVAYRGSLAMIAAHRRRQALERAVPK